MWKANANTFLPIGNSSNHNSEDPRDAVHLVTNVTRRPVEQFPESRIAEPEPQQKTRICRICAEKMPHDQYNAEMHRCDVCMQQFHTKTWPMHTIKKPCTVSETKARLHKMQRKRLHNKRCEHIPVQRLWELHGKQEVRPKRSQKFEGKRKPCTPQLFALQGPGKMCHLQKWIRKGILVHYSTEKCQTQRLCFGMQRMSETRLHIKEPCVVHMHNMFGNVRSCKTRRFLFHKLQTTWPNHTNVQ